MTTNDSTPPGDRPPAPAPVAAPIATASETQLSRSPLAPNDLPFGVASRYTLKQAIELTHFALCVGREAANQPAEAIKAVACSIRNRVDSGNAIRFGGGWLGVVTKPWAYSSMEGLMTDPNLRKWVAFNAKPWPVVLSIAQLVYDRVTPDNTQGAVSYFDRSLDNSAPSWSTADEFEHTIDLGSFHFYKLRSMR